MIGPDTLNQIVERTWQAAAAAGLPDDVVKECERERDRERDGEREREGERHIYIYMYEYVYSI